MGERLYGGRGRHLARPLSFHNAALPLLKAPSHILPLMHFIMSLSPSPRHKNAAGHAIAFVIHHGQNAAAPLAKERTM